MIESQSHELFCSCSGGLAQCFPSNIMLQRQWNNAFHGEMNSKKFVIVLLSPFSTRGYICLPWQTQSRRYPTISWNFSQTNHIVRFCFFLRVASFVHCAWACNLEQFGTNLYDKRFTSRNVITGFKRKCANRKIWSNKQILKNGGQPFIDIAYREVCR